MKALLVVDVQDENIQKELIENINSIIKNYEANNVYYIKSETKKFNFFKKKKSNFSKPLEIISNNIFVKNKGNAFSNKELNIKLKENNIKEIDIIGIDYKGSIGLTAAGAIKRNFIVSILLDGVSIDYSENIKKNLEKLGIKIK